VQADPRNELQPAFVLHRRPYSNTSLLLEVFLLHEGRMPLLAKGATAGRALGASLLQPFLPLLVSRSGRGEVRTLGRFEAAGPPLPLRGPQLYCGFYVNELMVRLVEREAPHRGLFAAYQTRCGGWWRRTTRSPRCDASRWACWRSSLWPGAGARGRDAGGARSGRAL